MYPLIDMISVDWVMSLYTSEAPRHNHSVNRKFLRGETAAMQRPLVACVWVTVPRISHTIEEEWPWCCVLFPFA